MGWTDAPLRPVFVLYREYLQNMIPPLIISNSPIIIYNVLLGGRDHAIGMAEKHARERGIPGLSLPRRRVFRASASLRWALDVCGRQSDGRRWEPGLVAGGNLFVTQAQLGRLGWVSCPPQHGRPFFKQDTRRSCTTPAKPG